MDAEYYAHTPATPDGEWHKLEDHLREVARMAAEFGEAFGAGEEAQLAGLLHDAGKASELFLARLQGKASGLDHWSSGAWLAFKRFRDPAAAFAIAAHHVGLRGGRYEDLLSVAPRKLSESHPDGLRLTEDDDEQLLSRIRDLGLAPQSPSNPVLALSRPLPACTASSMLDVRMLCSALVDADFLDTEAHFSGARQPGLVLDPQKAFEKLLAYRENVRSASLASSTVNSVRDDLWEACIRASQDAPGLFTLTAPTGSGKTLAMLGFALRHAIEYDLRRVVVVVPYLTIIEQTVNTIRQVYADEFGPDFVLEHHSLAGTRQTTEDQPDRDDRAEYRRRELAENWDAPIIVTTSVQLLESLFAARPAALRKLHRLARSVILFDEVQTLPLNLAVATLKTLSRLASQRYRSTVVFATATQPAFGELHPHVAEPDMNRGWQPREIATADLGLFGRSRRVRADWSRALVPSSWETIADLLESHRQLVCVVNLKRHAAELTTMMRDRVGEAALHLSTGMCPAHRQHLVENVRARLSAGEPCCLISTSCIEAGVDLDFEHGMRAFADLTSIAQAAGRVNRNGLREKGVLEVFRPDDTVLYPPGAMEQAAAVTEMLLRKSPRQHLDITDPAVFQEYFANLYSVARPETLRPQLAKAILAQDYAEVARLYRLIPETGVNILVPYRPLLDQFQALADEARAGKLGRGWLRRARPLTVTTFLRRNDPIDDALQPVHLSGRNLDEDWFICWRDDAYDDLLGLTPPSGSFSWNV